MKKSVFNTQFIVILDSGYNKECVYYFYKSFFPMFNLFNKNDSSHDLFYSIVNRIHDNTLFKAIIVAFYFLISKNDFVTKNYRKCSYK